MWIEVNTLHSPNLNELKSRTTGQTILQTQYIEKPALTYFKFQIIFHCQTIIEMFCEIQKQRFFSEFIFYRIALQKISRIYTDVDFSGFNIDNRGKKVCHCVFHFPISKDCMDIVAVYFDNVLRQCKEYWRRKEKVLLEFGSLAADLIFDWFYRYSIAPLFPIYVFKRRFILQLEIHYQNLLFNQKQTLNVIIKERGINNMLHRLNEW